MNKQSSAPTSRPLRIAVVGVGAIGSTFAFQLARTGGHDVTAVARPNSPRLAQLQRDHGIIDTKGNHAYLRVSDRLDEQIPYDLVIVTLLAHQVDAVLPVLQKGTAKCVQFMFNIFDPERLQTAVGEGRCAFGMPFVQALIDKDGRLNATIGAGGQMTKMSRQSWVDVFVAAGLPAVLEPKMPLWLRCHVPLCVAFESISVAGTRRGRGAAWGDSITLARGMREGFELIERLGYPLYPAAKARLKASPVWIVAGMLWVVSRITSFRELLATGIGECQALVEVMVAAAARANPPMKVAAIAAMKP